MKLQPQSFSVVSVLTLLVAFCAPSPACLAQNGEPTEADITSVTAWLLDREQFSKVVTNLVLNATWTNLRASVRGWL